MEVLGIWTLTLDAEDARLPLVLPKCYLLNRYFLIPMIIILGRFKRVMSAVH